MYKKLLLLAGLCSTLTAADLRQQTKNVAFYSSKSTIGLLQDGQQPKLDGIISENEYVPGITIAGFSKLKGSLVADKRGFVSVAMDAKYVYVAIRTTTPNTDPGGGLRTQTFLNDKVQICGDDSVELSFCSDTVPNKVYHMILNSFGAIFDREVQVNVAQGDNVKWNCEGIQYKNRISEGFWNIELKIPRKSIGNPSRSMRFLIGRNWSGTGATNIVSADNHLNPKQMMLLTWDRNPLPTLKYQDLGIPENGNWNIQLELAGVPKGGAYDLNILLNRHDYPRINGKIVPKITESGWVHKKLSGPGHVSLTRRTGDKNIYSLYILLKDAKTGRYLHHRRMTGIRGRNTGKFPASGEIDLKNIGSGSVFYYPGYKKMTVEFLPVVPIKSVAFRLNNGPEVKGVPNRNGVCRVSIPTPAKPGRYTLALTMTTKDGKTLSHDKAYTLTVRNFRFTGKSLGHEKLIIPPFKPVKVSGNKADYLLRSTTFHSAGLWRSVKADGRELLARPMYYEAQAGGKKITLKNVTPKLAVKEKGYEVQIASEASGDGVTLKSASVLECDGFFWNRLTVQSQQDRKLERLTLVIPLKESEVRLFHAVTNGIRHNPSGALPKGKGMVWNGSMAARSADFGSEEIHPQVVPYIWLGTEARGLSFFLNSSYGMKLDRKRPAFRIMRENGEVRLEVDLINIPVNGGKREIAFGFHATPVKPIPTELKEYTRSDIGHVIEGMKNICILDGRFSGLVSPHSHRVVNWDNSLADTAIKAIKTGNPAGLRETFDQWRKKYIPTLQRLTAPYPTPDPRNKTYMDWLTVGVNYWAKDLCRKKPPQEVYRYSDPHLVSFTEEESHYFIAEWTRNPLTYTTCRRTYFTPSLVDYMVYCYDMDMKSGLGIYLDDMFLVPCENTDTLARLDAEGERHADYGILAMRDLVRRISVRQHQLGVSPRILEIHMTNALLVPVFSYATVQLNMEDHFGESYFRTRYNPETILTEMIGLKIGALPVILPGVWRKTTPPKQWYNPKDGSGRSYELTRGMFAFLFPYNLYPKVRWDLPDREVHHELLYRCQTIMSRFGFFKPDSKFMPYWENDGAVSGVDAKKVLCSWFKRPNETLIILGNTIDTPQKIDLKIDLKKLGLPANTKAFDPETGKEIKFPFTLKDNDFRMVYLGKRIGEISK